MLNKDLEKSLNSAFHNARQKRHEFITVEHLLQGLLENDKALEVLLACGCDLVLLSKDIEDFIAEEMSVIDVNEKEYDTQPTLGFQRVLQRAVFHVQSSGNNEVSGANVLVAIFGEQDSQAVYFLEKQNVSRIDVVNYISHGATKDGSNRDEFSSSGQGQTANGTEEKSSALSQFAENLNQTAKEGAIDPLIGREKEVHRVVQVLSRRQKNNPLLVGESGVGKTAVAEGLAKLIVDQDVPDVLADSVIYSLDLGALLAGTKYRGDFEKRLKAVLKELKTEKKAILLLMKYTQ